MQKRLANALSSHRHMIKQGCNNIVQDFCYCFHCSFAALFLLRVSLKPGTEGFILLQSTAGGMTGVEWKKRHPCEQLHQGFFFIPSTIMLLKYGVTALP